MGNATQRDVQAGWSIFRDSEYQYGWEQLNRVLADRGFNTISKRTYSHYRKLHRYGYTRYVPINQLDVAVVKDPVWDSPLRSRYRLWPFEDEAQLLLGEGDDVLVLGGTLTELRSAMRMLCSASAESRT